MSSGEIQRKEQKPNLALTDIADIISSLYNFQYNSSIHKLKLLDSYDDQNVYINGIYDEKEIECCIKIHNGVESKAPEILDCQNQLLLHLYHHKFNVPLPLFNKKKERISYICINNITHAIRLLTWVKGTKMSDIKPSLNLIYQCGIYLAKIRISLSTFQHTAAYRIHSWDLKQTDQLKEFLFAINDIQRNYTFVMCFSERN